MHPTLGAVIFEIADNDLKKHFFLLAWQIQANIIIWRLLLFSYFCLQRALENMTSPPRDSVSHDDIVAKKIKDMLHKGPPSSFTFSSGVFMNIDSAAATAAWAG